MNENRQPLSEGGAAPVGEPDGDEAHPKQPAEARARRGALLPVDDLPGLDLADDDRETTVPPHPDAAAAPEVHLGDATEILVSRSTLSEPAPPQSSMRVVRRRIRKVGGEAELPSDGSNGVIPITPLAPKPAPKPASVPPPPQGTRAALGPPPPPAASPSNPAPATAVTPTVPSAPALPVELRITSLDTPAAEENRRTEPSAERRSEPSAERHSDPGVERLSNPEFLLLTTDEHDPVIPLATRSSPPATASSPATAPASDIVIPTEDDLLSVTAPVIRAAQTPSTPAAPRRSSVPPPPPVPLSAVPPSVPPRVSSPPTLPPTPPASLAQAEARPDPVPTVIEPAARSTSSAEERLAPAPETSSSDDHVEFSLGDSADVDLRPPDDPSLALLDALAEMPARAGETEHGRNPGVSRGTSLPPPPPPDIQPKPARVAPATLPASPPTAPVAAAPPAQAPPAVPAVAASSPAVPIAAASSPAISPPAVPPPAPPMPPPPPSAVSSSSPGVAPPARAAAVTVKDRRRRMWWEDLFNEDYFRTMERLDVEQTQHEADWIEQSLGVEQGARILDLACGAGRQAIELARRRYSVVGLDLSAPMLGRGAERARDAGVKVEWVQADMSAMDFTECFDATYCVGASFGYFDDERNVEVARKIHRALKPHGTFLMAVVNRDHVIRHQPAMSWFEGDGCLCMEETAFNFITSRLNVKRTMIFDDGRQRELEYSVRIYSLHELGELLHRTGFRIVEVSGHRRTPGAFFGPSSRELIILAQKRGTEVVEIPGGDPT